MWIQQIKMGHGACGMWQRHVWTMDKECRILFSNVR